MISGFDYSKYLKQKKIFGIVKLNNTRIIGQERGLYFYLFNFKSYLFNKLEKNYDDKEIGFLKAILQKL